LNLIKAPLRVKSTDNKSKFRGLSEQKIRELLEDKEEWVKMTESIQGRYKIAVITYLTGIFDLFYPFLINLVMDHSISARECLSRPFEGTRACREQGSDQTKTRELVAK